MANPINSRLSNSCGGRRPLRGIVRTDGRYPDDFGHDGLRSRQVQQVHWQSLRQM
jgi:hypothetical protein